MNAVLDKASSTTSIMAEGGATSAARNHKNIDHHVARVAQQIALLLEPIMTTWSWPDSFPGQDQMIEAADLLNHVIDESMEWDQEREKPSTCDLMAEAQGFLEQSLEAVNTRDAIAGHDARRLLLREALTRAKAASCWCSVAHTHVENDGPNGYPVELRDH